MSHIDITQADRDGTLREAADAVAGDTRAEFLAKSVLAGTAVAGGAALITPAIAGAQSLTKADRNVANFALLLEELESAFYADAVAKAGLTGEVLTFAQTVGGHEAEHVKALRALLRNDAIAAPTFDFGEATSGLEPFLKTAVVLEDTGVAAYKGQAPNIRSRSFLLSALKIHSVEAKHAAWARQLAGVTPIPRPADLPLTKAQVTKAVNETGFIKS